MTPRRRIKNYEELKEVLDTYKEGLTFKKVGERMGTTDNAAELIINQYLSQKKGVMKPYFHPVRIEHINKYISEETNNSIAAKPVIKQDTPQVDTNKEDSFKKIERLQNELILAIVEVAKEEVQQGHKEEINDIKRKYEEQLRHYQELLLLAQNSSMISVVKRGLGLNR